MSNHNLIEGDCIDELSKLSPNSVDLVYLDPPFFTQTVHQLQTRDGKTTFNFSDIWDSDGSYADFLFQRLLKIRELMKPTGSIFFHCDKAASHIIRLLLDSLFGTENFRSEIIWYFRRWSNSKKGLLNAHQNIHFYSKTGDYKFNRVLTEYSPTTNVDQILQKRSRDERNKSVYARDNSGSVITNGSKKGVPLSDVWEIPFLNPKAKERMGYPTQKPVLLLERIISLVTDEGDTVLDPFCGSGTTLVAAQALSRSSIGIDCSAEAIELTKQRLNNAIITSSNLLKRGRESYRNHDNFASKHLGGVSYTPVHRNKGIDALLKREFDGKPVFVRVQREDETVDDAATALRKAAKNKGECCLIVVATTDVLLPLSSQEGIQVVLSTSQALTEAISNASRHLATG